MTLNHLNSEYTWILENCLKFRDWQDKRATKVVKIAWFEYTIGLSLIIYIVYCQATMHGAAAHPIAGGCSKTIILAKENRFCTAQTSSHLRGSSHLSQLKNRSAADTRRIFKTIQNYYTKAE